VIALGDVKEVSEAKPHHLVLEQLKRGLLEGLLDLAKTGPPQALLAIGQVILANGLPDDRLGAEVRLARASPAPQPLVTSQLQEGGKDARDLKLKGLFIVLRVIMSNVPACVEHHSIGI
jgi:hypothetical protein